MEDDSDATFRNALTIFSPSSMNTFPRMTFTKSSIHISIVTFSLSLLACLQKAIKRKAFSRAFRQQVPAEAVQQLEAEMGGADAG